MRPVAKVLAALSLLAMIPGLVAQTHTFRLGTDEFLLDG